MCCEFIRRRWDLKDDGIDGERALMKGRKVDTGEYAFFPSPRASFERLTARVSPGLVDYRCIEATTHDSAAMYPAIDAIARVCGDEKALRARYRCDTLVLGLMRN